jgi:hypothetical protein
MSNIDFETRDDRTALLDRFARESPTTQNAIIPQQAIDVQGNRIVGAQQVAVYRDESRVLQRISVLAAAAGGEWYYRFPVKNRKTNTTDYIEGPSIKLANDVARLYGNCDVDCRVVDTGDSWLFYARFVDIETGYSLTRPFQQRKSGSQLGGSDDSRRLDIALQIGASKAIRNVVCNGLQFYTDFAFEEAKRALVTKIGEALPAWRERMKQRLVEHVAIARVERIIGRALDDWLAPDIARVIAMMKSVSDGMATLDETFRRSMPTPRRTAERRR